MSKNFEKPKGRRSSLKTHDNSQLDPSDLVKLKNKRNSVSWGQSNTFQFKAMKAMFQETNDINKPVKDEAKHKQFIESRKKSIKNEFSIVKELMKNNKNIEEEDDMEVDDEVKENTDKNVLIGKEGLKDESETSEKEESKSSHSCEEDN